MTCEVLSLALATVANRTLATLECSEACSSCWYLDEQPDKRVWATPSVSSMCSSSDCSAAVSTCAINYTSEHKLAKHTPVVPALGG